MYQRDGHDLHSRLAGELKQLTGHDLDLSPCFACGKLNTCEARGGGGGRGGGRRPWKPMLGCASEQPAQAHTPLLCRGTNATMACLKDEPHMR